MNNIVYLAVQNKSHIFMLISMIIYVLFGLVASKYNFLVIFALVLVFIGLFLLTRPIWIMWSILFMGLIVVGPIPLIEESLDPKAAYPAQILSFCLLLIAAYKVVTTSNTYKGTPSFIWAILCFIAYTILSAMGNFYSLIEFASGFKRDFQMWGILFALCWLDFDERNIHRWLMFFLMVALIQWFFVLYELVAIVPLREGFRDSFPGMVPIDAAAGTFGATIYGGGNSGDMASFLIIIMGFLLARKLENTLSTRGLVQLSLWVLAPLFMGETKVVIIMLPLMLLVLYRRELLANPHYALLGVIGGGFLMMGAGLAYVYAMHMSSISELYEATLSYNTGEEGYGSYFLNRTTALTFWLQNQGASDPISFIFGNGLGSAYDRQGHIDLHFPRYGVGLSAVSTMLWETGLFGCFLLITVFILAWRAAGRLYQESSEAIVRADASAIQVALVLFSFHLSYTKSLLEATPFQIVFASVLGYLAWLYRKHTVLILECRS